MSGEQLEAACELTHKIAAPPCTKRGGVREPHALRRYPSPRLAPHLARNTQTKHPGMARFARRA